MEGRPLCRRPSPYGYRLHREKVPARFCGVFALGFLSQRWTERSYSSDRAGKVFSRFENENRDQKKKKDGRYGARKTEDDADPNDSADEAGEKENHHNDNDGESEGPHWRLDRLKRIVRH